MTQKNKKTVKESVEYFLYENDSVSATAAKFVLATLVAGPLLVVGAIIPNLSRAFASTGRSQDIVITREKKRKYSDKQLRYTLYYLRKQKYISILKKKDGKATISLTVRGRRRVKKFAIDMVKISHKKKWDGLWRVVLFDIPIKRNGVRTIFRNRLKAWGFFQLQKSVWVFPYECEDELLYIAHLFDMEEYIEIITTKHLLYEASIKRYFKL